MAARQADDGDRERRARTHLADELVRLLPAFSRWVSSIRNADTPYGRVAYRQVEILYLMRKGVLSRDHLSPSHLADHFAVQRSVVTRLLASLEANDFIARRIDPDDRRNHIIAITDKGIAVSEYIEEIFTREMLAGTAFLAPDEIECLTAAIAPLWRLSGNLEALRKERVAERPDGFRTFDDEPL